MMEAHYTGYAEDPAGFFYIYLDDGRRQIVVEHYDRVEKDAGHDRRTVSGRVSRVFRGKSAQTLYRTIVGNNLVSLMDHAAYLGCELGKAETALNSNVKYEQDRPVRV